MHDVAQMAQVVKMADAVWRVESDVKKGNGEENEGTEKEEGGEGMV
jgi:hypothetical protein